ncbi:hypothetical protein HPB50_007181 [Hyalomma asiaticum]|uniref:Uncharacterized protein n=1 Tax=Hyalomma asiaticum TaxID=266040 RepID=A0ACB7SHB8_HYAAI|nr:hypothetical protein HPB50_007181 [Hyalomma asiaticum]
MIAVCVCRARVASWHVRKGICPVEVQSLCGWMKPSEGHSRRICKILKSEWWRQVRTFKDLLRIACANRMDGHPGSRQYRQWCNVADSTSEFFWRTVRPTLRVQKKGKPVQGHVLNLSTTPIPEEHERVLGLGPKYSFEPYLNPFEKIATARAVSRCAKEDERSRGGGPSQEKATDNKVSWVDAAKGSSRRGGYEETAASRELAEMRRENAQLRELISHLTREIQELKNSRKAEMSAPPSSSPGEAAAEIPDNRMEEDENAPPPKRKAPAVSSYTGSHQADLGQKLTEMQNILKEQAEAVGVTTTPAIVVSGCLCQPDNRPCSADGADCAFVRDRHRACALPGQTFCDCGLRTTNRIDPEITPREEYKLLLSPTPLQ